MTCLFCLIKYIIGHCVRHELVMQIHMNRKLFSLLAIFLLSVGIQADEYSIDLGVCDIQVPQSFDVKSPNKYFVQKNYGPASIQFFANEHEGSEFPELSLIESNFGRVSFFEYREKGDSEASIIVAGIGEKSIWFGEMSISSVKSILNNCY